MSVCMCVCSPVRLLTTSGVIWTAYDSLNKLYGFHMAAVVDIDSEHGVSIICIVETSLIRVS